MRTKVNIDIRLHCYHMVDAASGGLSQPSIVSLSALIWFIIYILYRNLQFLDHRIIINSMNPLSSDISELSRFVFQVIWVSAYYQKQMFLLLKGSDVIVPSMNALVFTRKVGVVRNSKLCL